MTQSKKLDITTPYPNNVRHHIKQQGYSIQEVADEIGVARRTFSDYLSGKVPIPRQTLNKIAEYIGCDINGLTASPTHFFDVQAVPETPVFSHQEAPLPPTRFLTMKPEELLTRYADEKEHLLALQLDSRTWTLPQVVMFDNSPLHLPLTAIHVEPDRNHPQYVIPREIEGKAQDVLAEVSHHFHDSTSIRLNGIRQSENSITLIVSKAHYLQYVATNYAMDALLTEKGWTRSLRDTVHPTARLCSLERSLLANHIGIGTLVFTADNYLVLPVRSKENVGIWRQEISPSISGATNYDDDMYSLKSGPVASWMREGREELGIENSDFATRADIFLGITRELLRGGKPEIFFATQLNVTRAALEQKFQKARDKWENMELKWREFTNPLKPPTTKQERTCFKQEFMSLLNQYESLFAPPMQASLILWYKYMLCKQNQ